MTHLRENGHGEGVQYAYDCTRLVWFVRRLDCTSLVLLCPGPGSCSKECITGGVQAVMRN